MLFSCGVDKAHLIYSILSFLDELHIRHNVKKNKFRMMKQQSWDILPFFHITNVWLERQLWNFLLRSQDIKTNKSCEIYNHICTFAAPSSDNNMALDCRLGCVIEGLRSCICWMQYATPIITLILPFQSI